MKKLLLLLFVLLLTTFVKGQDPLPTDTARHDLPFYSFSFYTRDSSVYISKGAKYKHTKLISNRKARQLIDSLGRSNSSAFKLKVDTVLMSGWFSNYKGSLKENTSNKQNNLTTSSTKYPTVDAVNAGLGAKQDSLSVCKIVLTNNITTYSLPFTLKSKSLIFVNGSILNDNLYSGIGTSNITLYIDPKQYDYLKILN